MSIEPLDDEATGALLPGERGSRALLDVDIHAQPDDTTCGPTCLDALYRYYGDSILLQQVIDEVQPLDTGGTLAVFLAIHALKRNYQARIYTYNLQLFDPTWFATPRIDFAAKLREQQVVKHDPRMELATNAYLEFFERGGECMYHDLSAGLLRRYLKRGVPVLTGLSATYLYACSREDAKDYNDVAGAPTGHFVILAGYDSATRMVDVVDPLYDNPGFGSQHYAVRFERLIAAILLGVMTYDANLLVIEPKRR